MKSISIEKRIRWKWWLNWWIWDNFWVVFWVFYWVRWFWYGFNSAILEFILLVDSFIARYWDETWVAVQWRGVFYDFDLGFGMSLIIWIWVNDGFRFRFICTFWDWSWKSWIFKLISDTWVNNTDRVRYTWTSSRGQRECYTEWGTLLGDRVNRWGVNFLFKFRFIW